MQKSSLSIFSLLSQSFSSAARRESPILYSFLQPSVFPFRRKSPPEPPPSSEKPLPPPQISSADNDALEKDLQGFLNKNQTDEAWKSFKSLASTSSFPSRHAFNSLISHLASLNDFQNLKRAFTSAIFLLEKSPEFLETGTLELLFRALDSANATIPTFALIRSMLKNRCFVPFNIWGEILLRMARKNNAIEKFLVIFEENCRIGVAERMVFMKPNIVVCNEILDACCRELGSPAAAEKVLKIMSGVGVIQDDQSFGALAYLYAWKGLKNRIVELDHLLFGIGLQAKTIIYSNLARGYIRSGDIESTTEVILRALKAEALFDEETYAELSRCFLDKGRIKDLAQLVIESQQLELPSPSLINDNHCNSFGYRIIASCVNQGMVDKAHSILDEMNSAGGPIGTGVYSSILRAYCKQRRTAEAAQLVAEISSVGLQLDAECFDTLIEASMSCQDFQSALSLFRDMREGQFSNLKHSYLAIMTGLMENQRPELMAGFLDSVVDDPRVEIATHDWNSIIHAFCKIGRLEDARRTYRRMIFLQFEPSEQTFLSLINGYVSAEKFFSVVILWSEIRRKGTTKLGHASLDAFLFALVKGGFFDAAMEVIEKSKELKIFLDKWRHKQVFMENHKKLRVTHLRKRNFRKMEALIAFKNWAGLNG